MPDRLRSNRSPALFDGLRARLSFGKPALLVGDIEIDLYDRFEIALLDPARHLEHTASRPRRHFGFDGLEAPKAVSIAEELVLSVEDHPRDLLRIEVGHQNTPQMIPAMRPNAARNAARLAISAMSRITITSEVEDGRAAGRVASRDRGRAAGAGIHAGSHRQATR